MDLIRNFMLYKPREIRGNVPEHWIFPDLKLIKHLFQQQKGKIFSWFYCTLIKEAWFCFHCHLW